jgi:ketosteroid isomerase-like protein
VGFNKNASSPTLSAKHVSKIKKEVEQVAKDHLHAKDAGTALSHYTEDATVVSNGFLYPSFNSFADHIKKFYGTLGKINLAVWDKMFINVISVDAALLTATFRWSSTDSAGKRTCLQGVWSALFVLKNGIWKISMRHESFLPLDNN